MEVDKGGFSIREYTRRIRNVEVRKCWPFSGEITGDVIQSLLPPITVAKSRWWSHELASLLTKSPVSVDDSDSSLVHKAKVKSKPCKKRSIVEIFAVAPKIEVTCKEEEGDDSDVLIGSKRKRTMMQKKIRSKEFVDSGNQKLANKVKKSREQAREKVDVGNCSFRISKESSGVVSCSSKKVGLVSKDHEFQIPAILKARRKVCFVRSPDKYAPECERQVRFSDQSGHLSHLKRKTTSLDLCCLEMNRLSLSSSEDKLLANDKAVKDMLNDPISGVMHLESRQQNKVEPAVSERDIGHSRAKSDLSYFPGPHLSSQDRVTDVLGSERKGCVAQPVQSLISTSSESSYRTCSSVSQLPSAGMHCGTLLHQSRFDPLVVEWRQISALHCQRNVEEEVLRSPLNLQGELVKANGEGCGSLDQSGICAGSSIYMENNFLLGSLVDIPIKNKPSTEPAPAPAHNEKCHKYFPTRLGLDESFTEKSCFTLTNGDCSHILHPPVSEVNPRRSHTVNMSKQNSLNHSVNNRNVISKSCCVCLQNTQGTMRLMGKDVSVGTSYSGLVRTSERIIAPDASFDYSSLASLTHQSCLWRRTTLEVSENHSITSLDKNWNKAWLHDTSQDHIPLFTEPQYNLASQSRTNVIPDSEFAHTTLNPCYSFADKDHNFHGSGLIPPNSFTLSQQQLPSPSNYNNVSLVPDARESYLGMPFLCTDSAKWSEYLSPQSSFESSSFINSTKQHVSFYGSSSYTNVGATNKRLASIEEYPMKNHKIPKLLMQDGLNYAKEPM